MEITLANKNDAYQIAILHQQEINQGFLSQLGVKFLARLYRAMILSSDSFVIVVKDDSRVIGFISGCTNLKIFYKNFIKNNFFALIIDLWPKFLNPSIIKKVFETTQYSQHSLVNLPPAELLSVVCQSGFQGQGITTQMFDRFIKEMKQRGIKIFRVTVGDNLLRAIGFYEKVGFKFHSYVSVHNNICSRIYLYSIS